MGIGSKFQDSIYLEGTIHNIYLYHKSNFSRETLLHYTKGLYKFYIVWESKFVTLILQIAKPYWICLREPPIATACDILSTLNWLKTLA